MIERYARLLMKRVWSDESKYDKWLQVELAACEAWADEGVVPLEDMALLRRATYDIDRVNEEIDRTRHDMPAFLRSITDTLGPEGRWLHLGLTTSDVWDTATSLQLMEASDLLDKEIEGLAQALGKKAVEHKSALMIGRTHGIHAEPITFGLKLALWWDEMRRNRERLSQARKSIAVGKVSGPVGTHATVPPSVEAHICRQLGLQAAPVSNQILQRDRHAQFVTTLAIMAASLEKFATEVRSLQRTEIGEVAEDFPEDEPGSSSMPHKRNPELSERVCGLARLVRGYALTALENVVLWGERDISHSSAERVILPDACMALDYILSLFTGVISGLRVYPDRMSRNLEASGGVFFSQRVLLAMIDKGVGREDAYKTVQRCSKESLSQGKQFRSVVSSEPEITSRLTSSELDGLFDYDYYVRYVDETFQRVGLDGA